MTPPAWRRVVRLAAWAVASGVALGVTLRLAMRFVALEACVQQDFSIGGSLEVVAAGAALGTPMAGAYLALVARVPTLTRWAGPIGALGVVAMLALVPPPAAQSALAGTPDTPVATAAAFGLCFLAWGLALERIARGWSSAPHPQSAR